MILNFDVDGQKLTKTGTAYLASHSKNYLKFNFSFSDAWNDLFKYIIFKYKEDSYQLLLEHDEGEQGYAVIVPSQVLKGKSFRFTVYGAKSLEDDEYIITTQEMSIRLHYSGYTTDITTISNEPANDIFTTILDRLSRKYDDLCFDDSQLICRAEGQTMKIIPLSFLEDYYTKDETYMKSETDELLNGKADSFDFIDLLDITIQNLIGRE